jgi:hypothetical protein
MTSDLDHDDGNDALPSVDLSFESMRQLQDQYAPFLCLDGIFIATDTPAEPSTVLRFRLKLPDDFVLIEGTGVVVWTREPGCDPGYYPGMAIRFITLGAQSKELVEQVVATHTESGGRPFELEPELKENFEPGELEETTADDPEKFRLTVRGAEEKEESESAAAREPTPEPVGSAPQQGYPEDTDESFGELTLDEEGAEFVPPDLEAMRNAPLPAERANLALEGEQAKEERELGFAVVDQPELGYSPERERARQAPEQASRAELAGAKATKPPQKRPEEHLAAEIESIADAAGSDYRKSKSEAAEMVWGDTAAAETGDQLGLPFAGDGPTSGDERGDLAAPRPEEVLTPAREEALGPSLDQLSRPPGGDMTTGLGPAIAPSSKPAPRSAQGFEVSLIAPEPEPDTTPRMPDGKGDTGVTIVPEAATGGRSVPLGRILGYVAAALLIVVGGFLAYRGLIAPRLGMDHEEDDIVVVENQTETPRAVTATDAGEGAETSEQEGAGEGTETSEPGEVEGAESGPDEAGEHPGVRLIDSEPEPVQPPTPVATRRIVPMPTAGPADLVEDVSWRQTGAGTEIVITGNGSFDEQWVSVLPMSAPPRILIRLRQIKEKYRAYELAAGTDEVLRIRLGHHPEQSPPALYVVLDVPDPSVHALGTVIEGNQVRVTVGR